MHNWVSRQVTWMTAVPSSHCPKTCIQIFTKKITIDRISAMNGRITLTRLRFLFTYNRTTRRKKRIESNRIESNHSWAKPWQLNADWTQETRTMPTTRLWHRLHASVAFSLSLSLTKQSGDERWWKPVRKFAAKLAPVDAAILEIETLVKRYSGS